MRLEGLGKLKNLMTSSGIETATFQLVAMVRDIFLLHSIQTGPRAQSASYPMRGGLSPRSEAAGK
jgi:hypothetical protein